MGIYHPYRLIIDGGLPLFRLSENAISMLFYVASSLRTRYYVPIFQAVAVDCGESTAHNNLIKIIFSDSLFCGNDSF